MLSRRTTFAALIAALILLVTAVPLTPPFGRGQGFTGREPPRHARVQSEWMLVPDV